MAGPSVSLQLHQRQKQAQTLTPAVQQALKLLHLSSQQLDAVVRDALESNPLLALEDTHEAETPQELKPVPRARGAGYRPSPAARSLFGASRAGAGNRLDGGHTAAVEPGNEGGPAQRSLRDVLFEDIVFEFTDPVERGIAIDLAGLLDDAGYLAGDLKDVADMRQVPLSVIEGVLSRLQSIAPAGMFARTLSECLRLQLADRDDLDDAMASVLDHLELLTEKGPARLAAAAGIDPDALSGCLERLRALEPRPGAAIADAAAPSVVPDLIVRPLASAGAKPDEYSRRVGNWIVALNPALIPHLSLDRSTLERLRNQSRRARDKEYVTEKAQDATWLIKAVEQRTATILRVGVAIFERQRAFLEHGVERMRPMTQKDIAAVAEVHESTVSRAANDKFAATPQGVFALKFLFSAAIPNLDGGPDHAAKVVRFRLRELVLEEESPMSDDLLARLLRAEGYDIARRTVAKYREMLRIPSSVVRRRLARLNQC